MTVTCKVCKQPKEVLCTYAEYRAWKAGKLIQHAMPGVSADQRELLISGICGTCFDQMFKELKEEYGSHDTH